ncbi:3-hydroxyacyl-ACP dehydratase FabZ [Polynucleobacter necessarius]|uniref:3-hydroxyacyl-ACP dehydratase FabZ n=1 Tax=Polynucleobacter necessarius TaxID=576610 RepID=UPI000E09AA01|nr:3-hydroxyacyl-ACP dehydratase FabZ [Polynucleobacter necessarius]
MSTPIAIDIHKILKLLPHRYPFLLVDRVLEITPRESITTPRESITALKNVTMNEPFFQGHFPDFPVMPGVLIIEALAQTAALLILSEERAEDAICYFAGIDGARFKKPVLPGDQLIMTAKLERGRAGIYKSSVQATVDGEIAAEANITCAVRTKGA